MHQNLYLIIFNKFIFVYDFWYTTYPIMTILKISQKEKVMEAIDKIIGYEGIKKELRKFADIMRNPEKYETLGAKLPHGIMFYGEPGVGKSLMADCLIKASRRQCFECRKDKPDGEFVTHIRETFSKAMRNEPSIVLLDDLDKFSNEDRYGSNAEEYVTVQSCMDIAKDRDVLVIATVNDRFLLPDSLMREGRFDEKIEVQNPQGEDAKKIIEYYLSQKKYVADLDIDEVSKLLNGFSCAELESLINKAGVIAGFEGKSQIEMEDILKAYIKTSFHAPLSHSTRTEKQLEVLAYHETGHALVAELLQPSSVSLITIANHMGSVGGFTAYYECDDYWFDKIYMENRIMTLLAGRAATELKFGKVDIGAGKDIERAHRIAKRLLTEHCELGFSNYFKAERSEPVPDYISKEIAHELDKYYLKTKELIAKNMPLVDKIAKALMKKEMLSRAEIAKIINENK